MSRDSGERSRESGIGVVIFARCDTLQKATIDSIRRPGLDDLRIVRARVGDEPVMAVRDGFPVHVCSVMGVSSGEWI